MSQGVTFPLFHEQSRDGWDCVREERLFENPHTSIDRVETLTPNRRDKLVPWFIVKRQAAVAIAPVTEKGEFVLIDQERIPVRQSCLEFPAGQIDCAVNDITCEIVIETALRELQEETGYALLPGGRLTPLGWFLPSQGFTDEHVYLFKAEPVCFVSRPELDESEHISPARLMGSEQLRRMIADHEITNALTLALYARMAAKSILEKTTP
jgi:8-oxo-dGTP pyrophosphatase MutT (NUDIX family)